LFGPWPDGTRGAGLYFQVRLFPLESIVVRILR
jgi:hypothetical protein